MQQTSSRPNEEARRLCYNMQAYRKKLRNTLLEELCNIISNALQSRNKQNWKWLKTLSHLSFAETYFRGVISKLKKYVNKLFSWNLTLFLSGYNSWSSFTCFNLENNWEKIDKYLELWEFKFAPSCSRRSDDWMHNVYLWTCDSVC